MNKKHTFDEVLDSQKLFRLILTAIANPCQIVNISEFSERMYGKTPEFLALAMTLLDNAVCFHTCDNNELADEITSLTLAKCVELCDADFVFVSGNTELRSIIENVKFGTLRDPHRSSMIIIKFDNEKDTVLRLFGPGIKDAFELSTSSVVEAALSIRDSQLYEYPQGIDFIFVSQNGDLFAIPRLTTREAIH